MFASTFDQSGLRLICGEADKTSMIEMLFLPTPSTNLFSQNMEGGRECNTRNASSGLETDAQ